MGKEKLIKDAGIKISQKELKSLMALFGLVKPGTTFESYYESLLKRKGKRALRSGVLWGIANKESLRLAYNLVFTNFEKEVKSNKHKKRTSYEEYLQSDHWKKFKKGILLYASCLVCEESKSLVVHHLRYKDSNGKSILYKETPSDVAVLCWNCHTHLHDKYGRGATFGMKEIEEERDLWKSEKENEKLGFKLYFTNGKFLSIDSNGKRKIEESILENIPITVFKNATIINKQILVILRDDSDLMDISL